MIVFIENLSRRSRVQKLSICKNYAGIDPVTPSRLFHAQGFNTW